MSDSPEDIFGQRTCLLVLGMHRSGTSAFTRILNLMGAALPKQLIGPLPGNEAGHWEPERLVFLHDQMLAEAGSSWRDLRALDLAELGADRLAYYKAMIGSIIRDEFGDARVFVLKDPRICRFIPIYKATLAELGVRVQPFIMIRNPLEVSASLLARDKMPTSYGLLLWLRHCLDAEKQTRGMNRIFISYDQIVNDIEHVITHLYETMAAYLSISSDVQSIIRESYQFIRRNLRHHISTSNDLNLNPLTQTWINEAYLSLISLLAAGNHNLVSARLDHISDEVNNSAPLFNQLAIDIELLSNWHHQVQDSSCLSENTIDHLYSQIRLESEQHAQEIQRNSDQHERETQRYLEQYAHELARLKRIDYVSRLPPELTGLRRWLLKWSKRRRRFARDYREIAASPLFDRDWYLRKNPDVAAAGVDATLHYLQRGGQEGRAPGPYFEANAYLKADPAAAAAETNPLLRFLRTYKDRDEAIALIRKSPLFDSHFYLSTYPELAAVGVDPAVHYFLHGGGEDKNPGPFFSTRDYLRQNPDVAAANMNALYHYELCGRVEGRLLSHQQTAMARGPGRDAIKNEEGVIDSLNCRFITRHPELEVPENLPLDISVSVVIPTYNAGSELRPLVRKLLAQKGLKSTEVVIVDSGSTDGTAELSTHLGCQLVRIAQSEFSHSYSRNVGADAATGELLVFMVQDAYPIGDYWLFGLARCLFRPQPKQAQLAAVSCAEYPRADSQLFYDSLMKAHYDFIGCSDKDRVGSYRSDDPVSLRTQGQLSDIACAIRKDLFIKYQFIGQYAEDVTLGIRLIKDGYLVGMLSSIRVIHSHDRAADYYLRRAFVDIMFLGDIFPDDRLPEDNCLLGTLVSSLALWTELKPIDIDDVRSPTQILDDYIVNVRNMLLDDIPHLNGFANLGFAPLTSWVDHVNRVSMEQNWKFDEVSLGSARQTRVTFADRLSSLRSFLAMAYPLLDSVVAVELSGAIQNLLAMAIGQQLAYCCLRPRGTIEFRQLDELLQELRSVMITGI
jgi:glycosyltransferase involved in cell wall biosynthesis